MIMTAKETLLTYQLIMWPETCVYIIEIVISKRKNKRFGNACSQQAHAIALATTCVNTLKKLSSPFFEKNSLCSAIY